MRKICDLHIHSKYSGGASKNIDILKIALNCKKKGIDIVGSGDCLHSAWLSELKSQLSEYTQGIFCSLNVPNVYFVLQTEIEVIWKYNNHLKKVHFVILFPNFEKVEEVIDYLSKYGDLAKEGRAKIYISAEKLIFELNNIDPSIEIIPAHIFTPFYGIFSDSLQFNSIKEALGDGIHYIHSVETGLSADPLMIRKISELNEFAIISSSNSHSMNFNRLGREVTKLDLNKLSYRNFINSLRTNKIIKTFEFKPSGAKYFYDGHFHFDRNGYFCSPKLNQADCPYCGRKLTKGVLSRVIKLCDQKPSNHKDFQYIVPLLHLISKVLGGTEYDKKNLMLYHKLINNNDGEYEIWEGKSNFEGISTELIDAINKVKCGKFWFIPGYDSVYGNLRFKS